MEFCYSQEKYGSLNIFLKFCAENHIPFSFEGTQPYIELWNKGYIEPFIASVRLVFSHGRDDEFYYVVDQGMLEGAELPMHSGRNGVYNPRDLLPTSPYWEIANLDPHPKPKSSDEIII